MILLTSWVTVKIKKVYIYIKWLTLRRYSLCVRYHVKHSKTPQSCESGTETPGYSEETEAQDGSKLPKDTQLVNQAPDLRP